MIERSSGFPMRIDANPSVELKLHRGPINFTVGLFSTNVDQCAVQLADLIA